MLTDFEQLAETRSFKKVETPSGLENYSVFIGGNFIFVSNVSKRAVRFNLNNFDTKFTQDELAGWIQRIQKLYPGF